MIPYLLFSSFRFRTFDEIKVPGSILLGSSSSLVPTDVQYDDFIVYNVTTAENLFGRFEQTIIFFFFLYRSIRN